MQRDQNEQLLTMPKLWQKEDLLRKEFVHWPIDRPGTGKEINSINMRAKYNFIQNFRAVC